MTPRALMPDYLRLIALFGIVVVNVQYLGFSALHDMLTPMGLNTGDNIALWLVNGLALLKTYGLFSFMFGVGLGFLMRSAERRELPFGRIYRNRMIGLAVLGLIHGCLFFFGDILVIYSITGSILYLMRDWDVRRLVKMGTILLVVQALIAVPMSFAPQDAPLEFIQFEADALTAGGFIDAVLLRSMIFAFSLPFLLIFQGLSTLGWFCLGLAAVKSGMIDNASHPQWARARRLCLLPGVVISLFGAALWQWGPASFGAIITLLAAPLTTLGYLGLIAAISRPAGPIMSRALAAGGSSLSIYLGQSIILSTIFSGYGLGLWNITSRPVAIAIAITVTVALIVAVLLWRMRFKLGPFEWLLRRVTYAGSTAKSL